MLDELLLLVECPVTAVDARSTGSGRVAWITFADGCQAHLEFDRRCLAPLESGWILEGTAGGYAGGRRYRPAPDHELVDVPVEPSHTDQQAFYDALLAAACAGHVFPVTTDSILRVLLLRDAIAESLGAGREVRLTECEF